MKKAIIAAIVIALVLVMTVVVIGSKQHPAGTSMSAASSSTVKTNHVTIKDYMFMPMAITVKAGTTVTWTNQDDVHHTITADKPSSDAPDGMDIAGGQTYSFTFKKTGTYAYHCFPHPYMHGTVTVIR